MPKFSYWIQTEFYQSVEVEADNKDEASEMVHEMVRNNEIDALGGDFSTEIHFNGVIDAD